MGKNVLTAVSADSTTANAAITKPSTATPPLPAGARQVELSDNARQVLLKRYVRRGDDGQPAETVDEMFWRVAYHIARVETAWQGDIDRRALEFYDLLTTKRFFPNSPTFTGAGTPLGQLAACFVLPISDDMGRASTGIFTTLRDAALIQQTGGGNGFSFSRLRPKGSLVKSSAGQATGPVGFLRVYDHAFGEVAQGGCLLPETLVFTSKGLLRLDEIAKPDFQGWQPHSLEVATDEGPRHSPRAFNNGMAPILRVHTRQGLSLAGTPEHRVKVMGSDGPEWRMLKELRPGEWIQVKLGQHQGHLQALRQPELKHFNQTRPNLPSIIDAELAFFLGYLAGDGFVASREDDHRVGVSVAHTSYLIEEMPRLLERLFGVTVHRQQKVHDRSVTFVIDNRAVKEFFQLNDLAKAASRDVSVPRLIRQSPPEIVGAYIRGLFEADGTLSHGFPSLMSTSSRLVEEVSTLLIGLGCPVAIRSISPGLGHYGSLSVYQVRIVSTAGLQAWREKISCDQRSRFLAAYVWQNDLTRESTYVLPNPRYWLQPVLDQITLAQIDARNRGMGINYRSTRPHLRRSIMRYMRGDRQFTRSAYDELSRTFPEFASTARSPEGSWFVRVTGVEQAAETLTLDLEVDENHTYLAYGMVTHNTRRGANMAVLRVDHPDVEDFITCKTNENQITNFNISVGITDAFMRAVAADGDWDLRFPDVKSAAYKNFTGTLEQAEAAGVPIKVYKTVRARDLFEKIIVQAHHNGEPGLLFLDAANRTNPVPQLYQLEATNPCFIGTTRISTDRGLLTLEELAGNGSLFLAAIDERAASVERYDAPADNLGVMFRKASPVWQTRQDTPMLQLVTREGYTITATPDHKFLTSEHKYVPLCDLRPGDRLLIQSGEGCWSSEQTLPNHSVIEQALATMGQGGDRASGHLVTRTDFKEQYANLPDRWSHDLGFVMGTLVGDGWLSPKSNSPVGMVFGKDKAEAQELVMTYMQTWFNAGHLHTRASVNQLTYGRLPYEFFKSLGAEAVPAHLKRVPFTIWHAPREAIIGFLQGLFTADGSVNRSDVKKSCSIRLASASVVLLQEVQLLLLNLGIASKIHIRREAGFRPMPDGKGNSRLYEAHADYELIIDKTNRDIFLDKVGFIDSEKQQKATIFVNDKIRRSNKENFEVVIKTIEPAGRADVYDLTEPVTHSLIAGGFVAHNCGEQFLGPYENCCLGSVNLAQHFGADGTVDWEKLRESVSLSTIFLDDVVDANAYVPAVPELSRAAHRARRIGLGIMGLADLMYHVGVRYGSPDSLEFAGQVMEFVRYHAMLTSVELSRARGPFEAIQGSIYNPEGVAWTPPTPNEPYTRDWGRPAVDWSRVERGIRDHGIRNAAQTTIAPTGTIATVAACEGYGCEPVFALAYIRHVNDNGKDLQLAYASPLFEEALINAGLGEKARQAIVERTMAEGTCQGIPELPESLQRVFAVSADISAEEHVRMQAALQAFVDNSLSKTINFPAGATINDVATAYQLAWELGCKGITVYVTGSRDKVVLETKATADKKQAGASPAAGLAGPNGHKPEASTPAEAETTEVETAMLVPPPQKTEQIPMWHEAKKPRPRFLHGYTCSIETPLGKAFITINENGGDQPFEVFINTAKAGSDTAAVSEAIGRLISYILRLASPVEPRERLNEVVRQLAGIGGGRSMGFGPNRVRSLPDGVAHALTEYVENSFTVETARAESAREESSAPGAPEPVVEQPYLKIGDLCPECGQAAMVNEEGCHKCYACGFSEC